MLPGCCHTALIYLRSLPKAQHLRSPLHQVGHIQIIGVCDEIFIRCPGPICALLLVQRQPVPVLEAALPEPVFAALASDIVYPLVHAFPGFLQNPLIAVDLIHDPGNDHRHVAPRRRAVLPQDVRHHMRDSFSREDSAATSRIHLLKNKAVFR